MSGKRSDEMNSMDHIARVPNVVIEDTRAPAAVAEHVAATLAFRGDKSIALSGGSTPPKIFQELSGEGIGWTGARVYPTDERRVPTDHPASNVGMLRAQLGGSGAIIVELEAGMRPEPFDLVWVGMGDDGHVASLFPAMTIVEDPLYACVIETVPRPLPKEAPFARLTLNLAALVATKQILLVVSGVPKRRMLQEVLAAEPDLPVTRLLRAARRPVSIYTLD